MKKCRLNRILLWFFISFLFGCEPQPPKIAPGVACVTLGKTNLSIPNKYFRPGFPATLVPSQGLDKNVGELLRIPLRDLGYQIKTGIGYDFVLTFLVTPLNVHHLQNEVSLSALKAWKGTSPYKNRIIEFDNVTQLYRIYTNKYRKTWQFFESSPDDSMNPRKKWVAGCNIKFSETNLFNFSSITCDTTFLYKDIHIQMTFSGKYINLMEEFKLKIINLFRNWETETCRIN